MNRITEGLRDTLLSMIRETGEHPEDYTKNPGRDFTRRRSLTLLVLMYLILTMDEKSAWKGLLGYFQNKIDTLSASACGHRYPLHRSSSWIARMVSTSPWYFQSRPCRARYR